MTTGRTDDFSQAIPDYREGIKKDVAEIKFLIHDLRVEGFFNDILHYQVTLNTDLEIYNIEQAQVLHGADVGAEVQAPRRAQGAPGLLECGEELLAGPDGPAPRQTLRRHHP